MRKKLTKCIKKLLAFTLATTMTTGLTSNVLMNERLYAVEETSKSSDEDYDYARAFQQTLMFYEFQMSGDVSGLGRNNWIDDCDLEDGSDVGLDLTGGWHDAGDHVKFNLPMSYSATMLAWSYIEYQDTYKESGQDKYMLQQLRWVNDYFIKCHPEKYVYYYQVGDGTIDHQLWTAPCLFDDDETMVRPSFKVDLEHGGSAVCAGTAASLAAAAIIFKESDPEYAELCLKHADELYEFALITQTDLGYSGDNGNTKNEDKIKLTEEESKVYQKAAGFYTSSHFQDELSWGGAWLYKATGEKEYLETAESYAYSWGGEEIVGNLKGNTWTQCWDDVRYGAMLLIAQLDDSEKGLEFRDGIEYNLDYMSIGTEDGGAKNKRTPKGLIMINDWGSLRYAAAAAFLAMLYANWEDADPARVEPYKEFAKSQADYILGSTGRSFIVGYDETSPQNPHHRAAHGAWKNSPLGYPESNRHILVGAMVGGPLSDDSYVDDRNNYCTNEVSDDYNAGCLGLMSAMYAEYGGEIDPNLSAYEEPGREFTMSAGLYQHGTKDGGNYFEIKDCLINQTAWPSRVTNNLKYRVYVDISDVLEQGYTPEDFYIISYYSQYMAAQDQISGLLPYDEEKGIYYVEVDLSGAEMMPAGDVISRNDMQLYIGAPCEWDYMKSPSLQPILDTDGDTLIPNFRITVYEGDEKVFGYEPNEEMPEDPESVNTLMGTPISDIPANSPTTTSATATTAVTTEDKTNTTTKDDADASTEGNGSVTTTSNPNDTTEGNESTDTGSNPSATTEGNGNGNTGSSPSATTEGSGNGNTGSSPSATTESNGNTNTGSSPSTTTASVPEEVVKLNNIVMDTDAVTITELEQKTLNVIYTPANATNKNVVWRTNNPNVVLVSENGVITGLQAGKALVYAQSEEGNFTASCNVTVTKSNMNDTTAGSQGNTGVNNPFATTASTSGNTGVNSPSATTADNSGNTSVNNPSGTTAGNNGNTSVNNPSGTTAGNNGNTSVNNPSGTTAGNNGNTSVNNPSATTMDNNGNAGANNPSTTTADNNGNAGANNPSATTADNNGNAGANNPSATTVDNNGNTGVNNPSATTTSNNGNAGATTQNNASATTAVNPNESNDSQNAILPAKVTGLKKKNVKKTSFKLTWKKQTGISGYRVYCYNAKKGKYKLVKTLKASKNTLTVKKCKRNTTYRYRVAAYKKVGSLTLTGKLSKVLKVKTKK